MQTGKQFSQRRLLQATPYVVADPKLIDKALKARGIDTPAMHDRKLLRRFAKMLQQELQQKQESDEPVDQAQPKEDMESGRVGILQDMASGLRNSISEAQAKLNSVRGLHLQGVVWEILDVNGDGEICKAEFAQALAKNPNITLTDSEVDHVFNLLDIDGSQQIRVDEICAALQAVGAAALQIKIESSNSKEFNSEYPRGADEHA